MDLFCSEQDSNPVVYKFIYNKKSFLAELVNIKGATC